MHSRKKLLMFLIIPSGIVWLWLSLAGSLFSIPKMFLNLQSFLQGLISITGVICILIAVWSAFVYPKISKVSVGAFFVGFPALLAGAFFGFAGSMLYYISVLSLGWAGCLVVQEYSQKT
jgi:hypothetical protein